ncbi:DUF7835 family putative zinc beta-ribbon protein [Halobacterium noricense]|nr:hypothetical protein [Halobacterium noricense]UHH26799.1 hypothetical protein LT974_07675 [Halobacterium noricense]
MASKNVQSDGITEECTACGREQPHSVTIDILTESDKDENASFSREPYRVAECQACGTTTKTRMNNV